jgi:arabinogalactan oligomer/maltooligosaccharide transport system permease protein
MSSSVVTLSKREMKRRQKLGADYVAPSPYTLSAALKDGDVFTKLSIIFFGLGNFARHQIAKGVIFLAGEIGFIVFMIYAGAHNLAMAPIAGMASGSTEGWVPSWSIRPATTRC